MSGHNTAKHPDKGRDLSVKFQSQGDNLIPNLEVGSNNLLEALTQKRNHFVKLYKIYIESAFILPHCQKCS